MLRTSLASSTLLFMSSPFRAPLLATAIAFLICTPFLWYVFTHVGSVESGFVHAAHDLLAGKPFGYLGAYPPGIAWLYAGFLFFLPSFSAAHAAVFQTLVFATGAGLWWWLLRRLLPTPQTAWLAWGLSLLNPYLVWTAITSKDTSFEWLALVAFFALLWQIILPSSVASKRSSHVHALGLVALFFTGLLLRVSIAPVALGALLLALLLVPKQRRVLATTFAACVVSLVGLCALQARATGYIGLSTTMGLNTWYGQHELYEVAHPNHDIDVFFPESAPPIQDPVYSANGSRILFALGVARIKADPFTFFARSVRKSAWHWFNLEKIPNLTSETRLVDVRESTLTITTGPINHLPGMLYTLYKLVYLPLFFIALVLFLLKRTWRDPSLVFLAPMVALWPIALLTFPDTRFKIVAEAIACAFIAQQLASAWPTLKTLARQGRPSSK